LVVSLQINLNVGEMTDYSPESFPEKLIKKGFWIGEETQAMKEKIGHEFPETPTMIRFQFDIEVEIVSIVGSEMNHLPYVLALGQTEGCR
jgi:hypothetical protein